MDYPDRWNDRLPDEEERKRKAQTHWRPRWWHVVALLIVAAMFAAVFWPVGCGPGG